MQKYDGRVKTKLVPHNSAIRNGSVREWAWEPSLDLQLHPYPVRSRTPYPGRLRMLKKRIRSRTQIRETARNGPVTDRKPSGHRNGSVRILPVFYLADSLDYNTLIKILGIVSLRSNRVLFCLSLIHIVSI
ncbi:Protein CBG28052 [Caenorhabditis briggsae]|uniref:Protein CBG28052 n=1 Tax=Caenorhabditis briggsae TaxID=6238 RepID=B6IGP2_CAEBR|nr:Protein CBG28052 [Caenorhabditis briggsae]CAR99072.1 Protein CBG28052 [Caenorhabditis briggsae]